MHFELSYHVELMVPLVRVTDPGKHYLDPDPDPTFDNTGFEIRYKSQNWLPI